MQAPDRIETARLTLRRPQRTDADAIFRGFASDPEVTRYVGWPMHRSIEHTNGFLGFSDAQWQQSGVGPYLIELRNSGLIGTTGLQLESADSNAGRTASTGYVLARRVWGQGFASEALAAMVSLAKVLGIARLQAFCHPDHRASQRVLEKCSFTREGVLPNHIEFPNLDAVGPQDVVCYAVRFS
jgi:[ribosomal protein S5]-alanine N-acetyltransferase